MLELLQLENRESVNKETCSATILPNSTPVVSLQSQRIFPRKIRPQIRSRVYPLERRVHDGQQLQAGELARQTLERVLLGRVVDL